MGTIGELTRTAALTRAEWRLVLDALKAVEMRESDVIPYLRTIDTLCSQVGVAYPIIDQAVVIEKADKMSVPIMQWITEQAKELQYLWEDNTREHQRIWMNKLFSSDVLLRLQHPEKTTLREFTVACGEVYSLLVHIESEKNHYYDAYDKYLREIQHMCFEVVQSSEGIREAAKVYGVHHPWRYLNRCGNLYSMFA